MNVEKEEIAGVNVLHKADGITDEEEFQRARQVAQQQQGRLNDPYKLSAEAVGDNDKILVAIGGILAIAMVALLAMKNRQKISSKSN